MKKIMLLAVGMALFVLAGAFAKGSSEAESLGTVWDTVTITGTVSFKDWPYPEITSRGTTYELMVPHFFGEDIEIKSGDEITIEGIVVDHPDAEKTYLKVVRAVIAGEEYYLPFGTMGHLRFTRMPYGGPGRPGDLGRRELPGKQRGGRF